MNAPPHRHYTSSKVNAAHDQLENAAILEDPTSPQTDPSTELPTKGDISRIFTLPGGLQTMIYERTVIERRPIHLRIFVTNCTEETRRWCLIMDNHNKNKQRAPILAVCKDLRKFVAPIYFAGNTFGTKTGELAVDCKKREVLRQMWGEDVKHIRSVEHVSTLDIASWDTKYPYHHTFLRFDVVDITTKVKLLNGGRLIVSRHSSGTRNCDHLPRGAICQCEMDSMVAALGEEGKRSERLFEIAGLCAYEHTNPAGGKICDDCKLPRVVLGLKAAHTRCRR